MKIDNKNSILKTIHLLTKHAIQEFGYVVQGCTQEYLCYELMEIFNISPDDVENYEPLVIDEEDLIK